tara:strand:- start:119 stop:394 length:276 start_codon:yes stop_codon:yes gene_type:complete
MSVVGKVSGQVKSLLGEKTMQISLVGAVLFYILASPMVFAFVDNLVKKVFGMVGVDLKLEGNALVVLHSLVFGVLLYVSVTYLLEPLMKKM